MPEQIEDKPAGLPGGGRPAAVRLSFQSQENKYLIFRRLSKLVKRILNFLPFHEAPEASGRPGSEEEQRARLPGAAAAPSVSVPRPSTLGSPGCRCQSARSPSPDSRPSCLFRVQVTLMLPRGTRALDMSTQATAGTAQEAKGRRVPLAASRALGTRAGVLISCDRTLSDWLCPPAISARPPSAARSSAPPRVPAGNRGTEGPAHHPPVRGPPLCPALPRTSGNHALPARPGQRGRRWAGSRALGKERRALPW